MNKVPKTSLDHMLDLLALIEREIKIMREDRSAPEAFIVNQEKRAVKLRARIEVERTRKEKLDPSRRRGRFVWESPDDVTWKK
jgi:hypothetical protein